MGGEMKCCAAHFSSIKGLVAASSEPWAVRLFHAPGVWLNEAARGAVRSRDEWLLPPYKNTDLTQTNAADRRLIRGETQVELLRHGLIADEDAARLELMTSRVLVACRCGRPFIVVWFCVEPVPASQPAPRPPVSPPKNLPHPR